MEIAYLTAVTRSTTLPPYDPWFAGGTHELLLHGLVLPAVPIRALQILPEVAFNLGIPTFAAMGATVAFSTVVQPRRLGRGGTSGRRRTGARGWSALAVRGLRVRSC